MIEGEMRDEKVRIGGGWYVRERRRRVGRLLKKMTTQTRHAWNRTSAECGKKDKDVKLVLIFLQIVEIEKGGKLTKCCRQSRC